IRRLNSFFWAHLSMSLTADHPFDNAAIHQFIYENAAFDAFLTGKLLFRRTDLIQVFVTIVFSPFHAAFLTAIPLLDTSQSTGKTQPVATQDTFVRIRARETFHQHCESGLLRFFPQLHLPGFIHSGSSVYGQEIQSLFSVCYFALCIGIGGRHSPFLMIVGRGHRVVVFSCDLPFFKHTYPVSSAVTITLF
ncbi:hypothetical protein Q4R10_20970, partial [Morganella morganii]